MTKWAAGLMLLALLVLPRSISAQSQVTMHRYSGAEVVAGVLPDQLGSCDHVVAGNDNALGFRVASLQYNLDCSGMYTWAVRFGVDDYSNGPLVTVYEAQGTPQQDKVVELTRRQDGLAVSVKDGQYGYEQVVVPVTQALSWHTFGMSMDGGWFYLDGVYYDMQPFPAWGDPVLNLSNYLYLDRLAISDDSMSQAEMNIEIVGWGNPPGTTVTATPTVTPTSDPLATPTATTTSTATATSTAMPTSVDLVEFTADSTLVASRAMIAEQSAMWVDGGVSGGMLALVGLSVFGGMLHFLIRLVKWRDY